MNEIDIKALADKREANIQKLNSYLNAGKTADEKVVSRLIEQIRNAEKTLIDAGFVIEEKINDDGSFNKIEIPVINEAENKIDDTVVDVPIQNTVIKEDTTVIKARKNKPKKILDNKVEIKTEKFGVSVKEELVDKVKILGEYSNNKKPNDVVIDLLNSLFDGKDFNIEFEEKSKLKITSYNLPIEMVKAIEKINKKTRVPKSEIFNKLIEEALKNYF